MGRTCRPARLQFDCSPSVESPNLRMVVTEVPPLLFLEVVEVPAVRYRASGASLAVSALGAVL